MQQHRLAEKSHAKQTYNEQPERTGNRHHHARNRQGRQNTSRNSGDGVAIDNEPNVEKNCRATERRQHVQKTKLTIGQLVESSNVFAEERNEKRLAEPREQRKQKRADQPTRVKSDEFQ